MTDAKSASEGNANLLRLAKMFDAAPTERAIGWILAQYAIESDCSLGVAFHLTEREWAQLFHYQDTAAEKAAAIRAFVKMRSGAA